VEEGEECQGKIGEKEDPRCESDWEKERERRMRCMSCTRSIKGIEREQGRVVIEHVNS